MFCIINYTLKIMWNISLMGITEENMFMFCWVHAQFGCLRKNRSSTRTFTQKCIYWSKLRDLKLHLHFFPVLTVNLLTRSAHRALARRPINNIHVCFSCFACFILTLSVSGDRRFSRPLSACPQISCR